MMEEIIPTIDAFLDPYVWALECFADDETFERATDDARGGDARRRRARVGGHPPRGCRPRRWCRRGEVARTEVVVPARVEDLAAQGVWFGARRVDGSRLQASAPHRVRLR
jgi:hypothetical protein